MEVSPLSLIRAANLFSGVLSELRFYDGWLSFGPDFAKFVTDQKIEWWTLYEQPARLRIAMGAVVFTPDELKQFSSNPNGREEVIRAPRTI